MDVDRTSGDTAKVASAGGQEGAAMARTTTFYRLDSGGVARWIDTDDGNIEIALWKNGEWVYWPTLFPQITGLGGDGPADEISREEARALIDAMKA